MTKLHNFSQRVAADRAYLEASMSKVILADGTSRAIARFGRIGSKPLVVCAPTVPQLNFIYVPLIQALAERYEFVIYEPAMRDSRRTSLIDRSHELSAVIDALSTNPVHLLAWSDGGSAAYRLAQTEPAKVRSLVLLGLADRYRLPGPLDLVMKGLDRYPLHLLIPAFMFRIMLSWFLGGPSVPRRWVFAEIGQIRRLGSFVKYFVLPCMTDHSPQANEVNVSTLLVGGDSDALVSVKQFTSMASLLGADTEFVVIPGGEHMLGYASPRQVNQVVDEFLAQQD